MATVQKTVLHLGPDDDGRALTAEEFAEADYPESWRNERERGRLIVMPPDGPGHEGSSEPLHHHLGAYRLAHPDVVDRVASQAWIRVDSGTDRIPDIGAFLVGPRSAVARRDRVPVIVFEVVSPDRKSREREYVKKRPGYGRLGVLEYGIVDRMRHRATVYSAGPRGSRKRAFREGDAYESPLLPGPVIRLAEVPRES